MKALLVDLDDTLIDTSKFKNCLFEKISKKTSIDQTDVIRIYASIKNNRNGQLEDGWIKKFSYKLSLLTKVSTPETMEIIYNSVSVIGIKTAILTYVNKMNCPKFIITAGDKHFQKAKIEYLGIKKLFDGIIYTPKSKDKYLLPRIRKNKIHLKWKIFDQIEIIDDKDYLLNTLSKYSWIRIIHPDKIK